MNRAALIGGFLVSLAVSLIAIMRRSEAIIEASEQVRPDEPTPDQGDQGGAIASPFSSSVVDEFGNITGATYSEPSPYVSPVHANYEAVDNDMRMSDAARARLRATEKFSAKSYYDFKGRSIGYGHLIRPGDGLSADSVITEDRAAALFDSDVATFEEAVNEAIDVEISQNQFDALVSFAYNVGAPAFKTSTLVRKINAGDPNAAAEFARWIYAGGKKNDGLVARREQEKNTFLA